MPLLHEGCDPDEVADVGTETGGGFGARIVRAGSVSGGVLRHDRPDIHDSPILNLVMRDDVRWEDLIDTTDPDVRKAIQDLGVAIEPAVNRYLDATKD